MVVPSASAASQAAEKVDLRDFTGFLLRQAFVRAVGAERACMPDDGHVAEVTVLSVLAERGAVSQRELSDITHVNRTVIVRQVDALESKGWVRRDPNPVDRRSYALRLTTAGQAALVELSRDLDQVDAELTQCLTRDEARRLRRRLRELLADDEAIRIRSLADRTGFLVGRAHHTVRRWAEQQLGSLGIHPRDFGVLAIVGREQPCSQSRVAARLGITSPGVLGFVDGLVARGLLQRSRSGIDRRTNDLVLTTAGQQCLTAAVAAATEVQAELVRRLGVEREAELRSLLRKMIG